MSKTLEHQTVEWNNLPWKQIERRVFKLQKRIYRASIRGDLKAVRRLQKTLMRSWSAKCIAVRKVTQDNQGKRTAGVDGVKSLSPGARLRLVNQLKLTGVSQPTRRVWIDKPGQIQKRPLSIPTMYDRAVQALVKLALEPEWEARFEPNSYGFRPGRSAHDAIEAIHNCICQKAKYVLDADISQCFDSINHQALLQKLNTFPTLRRQIKSWLKSGVMEKMSLVPTQSGTPQGGVISPLLANIALHGLEKIVTQEKRATLIRYADDFVVIYEDKTLLEEKLKPRIERWLTDMGLELKPSKTRIAHTSEGFDFLGFHVRQYRVGTYRAAKNQHGKNLGFKTLITPSRASVKKHLDQLGRVIETHHGAPQKVLIGKLNPIIRGWCNYYLTSASKATYSKCDHLIYQKLRAWAKRKCPSSNGWQTTAKYWRTIGNNHWAFATHEGHQLYNHRQTLIKRHTKVQGARSPFDGDMVYWSTRLGKHPQLPSRVINLIKYQTGKCTFCGLLLKDGDIWEVDHIIPRSKGGKDIYSNLQLLHRHCHDVKTSLDGSGMHDKHQIIEEPCDGKLSCTVLNERVGR